MKIDVNCERRCGEKLHRVMRFSVTGEVLIFNKMNDRF